MNLGSMLRLQSRLLADPRIRSIGLWKFHASNTPNLEMVQVHLTVSSRAAVALRELASYVLKEYGTLDCIATELASGNVLLAFTLMVHREVYERAVYAFLRVHDCRVYRKAVWQRVEEYHFGGNSSLPRDQLEY